MNDRRPGYQDVFRAGTANGFDVPDVKTYYAETREGHKPYLAERISTPMSINLPAYGKLPIHGYLDVDLAGAHKGGKYGLYASSTAEAWVTMPNGIEKNLEDIMKPGDPQTVSDDKGHTMSLSSLQQRMTEFGAAAAEYPHVFSCDEYMQVYAVTSGRLGLAPPTTTEYMNEYLPSVEKELINKSKTFIGAIRKPEELTLAYESCADFQPANDIEQQAWDDLWLMQDDPNGGHGYPGS